VGAGAAGSDPVGDAGRMIDPDRELAREARNGDREALTRLYDRHKRRLFGMLVRMLGRGPLAEDTFQEVWLKVLNNVQRFEPKSGSFRAWLFRIAGNAAIDRLRRESKHRAAELDAPDEQGRENGADRLPSSLPGPDRLGQSRILAGQLNRALLSLPEQQRVAILLRHQQGLSYAEIATALHVPEGTAKTMVHRGVLKLRRQLREWSDA